MSHSVVASRKMEKYMQSSDIEELRQRGPNGTAGDAGLCGGVQPIPPQPPQRESATSSALASFDALPNSAHVRMPVVAALFACSPATVWRAVKANRIPAPHRLAMRVTAWQVGELRDALR